MEKISFDLLKQMMEEDHKGLVSIYMPTWRYGSEAGQSRIQLKNILKEAEERLVSMGYGGREAAELLKPCTLLLDDALFWQKQDKTLALFISESSFKHFRLPITSEETLSVSNKYYLRPLIKYLSSDIRFNVLTLSQSEIKLYKAGAYDIERVDVPEIDELVENYIPANELRQEATSPKGAAGGATSFLHGYNEMSQTEKNEISKHLRTIDKEVSRVLKDSGAPLLVYSVDYIYPMYKEVNTYPHLMEESIKGSPVGASLRDIHDKAMEIVVPRCESTLEREIEKFNTLKGTDSKLSSCDAAEITKMALHGRVERLFVADGVQQWGFLDNDTGEIIVDNREGEKHMDILDRALIAAMENGGKVYVLDKERMPVIKPAAAILRY
ncbi:hypothetical protein [Gudongella oleilytica]|uniref:baeRF7 domain-containing protein n=1 Tax=Gudongella oleilytica TaxID=1582259 RepID=UPI002A35B3DA|nr:hypothetical protein [Gudongella oleilytica]MDY0256109.1 hypothetical protein [Gudongella oleilytica]